MTRARSQMLLMLLYGLVWAIAFLAPGVAAGILMMPDDDRPAEVLFLTRVIGAANGLIALLLFFFITNASAGRRLMITLALFQALVIVAGVLAYTADDLSGDTTLIAVVGSAVLAVLNVWGGFGAERRVRQPEAEAA